VSEGLPPAGERRPDRASLVVALCLVVAAGVVAWDAAHMRAGVAAYSRIGPKAFPYAVATGLAILGLLTALQAFGESAPPRERDEIAPMAWIIGGLIAQIVLLRLAGFSIATGAVFAATARAFGRGPVWLTYPVGVALALGVWLFFALGLQLRLPAGPLELWAGSLVTGAVRALSGA
jgi:putative tricarboxylic transport membrane protein